MRAGPVIIGFDGSPAAEQATRAAAALFAPKPALVVYVWEAGRRFEAATLPERALEEPPGAGAFDIETGLGAERAASESAQDLAERGAALAREAGLPAEGRAVTDDATVADTLIRLARESDARAIVVGLHERHRLTKVVPTRTLTDLLHAAPCPVLICGSPALPAGRGRPAAYAGRSRLPPTMRTGTSVTDSVAMARSWHRRFHGANGSYEWPPLPC